MRLESRTELGRGGQRRVVAVSLTAAGVVACSLWTNLDGLRGADSGVEAGTSDAEAGGVACDGGIHVAGFDGYTASGDAVVEGGVLTANVATTGSGYVSAYQERDVSTPPSRVHLAYDATLTSSTVYAEEGCTLFLYDAQNQWLLHYFVFQVPAANGTSTLGDSINDLIDGGAPDQPRTVGLLGAQGSASHHVDVTVTDDGATGALTAVFDGQTRQDNLVFQQPINRVVVECGISYADGDGGTLTTRVTNVDLTVCP